MVSLGAYSKVKPTSATSVAHGNYLHRIHRRERPLASHRQRLNRKKRWVRLWVRFFRERPFSMSGNTGTDARFPSESKIVTSCTFLGLLITARSVASSRADNRSATFPCPSTRRPRRRPSAAGGFAP